MSTLSTHILDASTGRPAAGVRVWLERLAAAPAPNRSAADDPAPALVAEATTDADGRIARLDNGSGDGLPPGVYRICFDTGEYFARSGTASLYPLVTVLFTVSEPAGHLHVPLLLSPYAYSTYRGS